MSSTNRGRERNRKDNYPTPRWCVRRLLEAVELPPGLWLEPTAGDGAIIEAVNEVRSDIEWSAVELRRECRGRLESIVGKESVRISSFLDVEANEMPKPHVVITNPPFGIAMDIIEHARTFDAWVVMLLRLNFLGSKKRADFLRRSTPDVYVLPNRASFTGDRKTDSSEYAWFVWKPGRRRRKGSLSVLATTSLKVRKSDPTYKRLVKDRG